MLSTRHSWHQSMRKSMVCVMNLKSWQLKWKRYTFLQLLCMKIFEIFYLCNIFTQSTVMEKSIGDRKEVIDLLTKIHKKNTDFESRIRFLEAKGIVLSSSDGQPPRQERFQISNLIRLGRLYKEIESIVSRILLDPGLMLVSKRCIYLSGHKAH